jgi:hypothetical protein
MELMIAKFLDARTSDFIEPLHGNQCFPVELCCCGHGQSSSNAITSSIGNAGVSRLELMLCRTILGKSPLVSTSFANLTIDESLEAIPLPIN